MSDDSTIKDARNVEQFLLDRELLREADQGEDYAMTDRAAAMVRETLAEIDGLEDVPAFAPEWFDVEPDSLTFDRDGGITPVVDGKALVEYPSEAAVMADGALAGVLAEWVDHWTALSIQKRNEIISGLRLFLEDCPACESTVDFEMETVESCCGSYQVAGLICQNCGAHLYESPPLDRFE